MDSIGWDDKWKNDKKYLQNSTSIYLTVLIAWSKLDLVKTKTFSSLLMSSSARQDASNKVQKTSIFMMRGN